MNNRPYKTNSSNRELENESHLTNIANVPEPASYKEGYVHGRASERSVEKQREEVPADNITARGLLLGVALTSLLGAVVGILFYLSQRQETPQPTPVISPNISQPQNRETTIRLYQNKPKIKLNNLILPIRFSKNKLNTNFDVS